MAPPQRRPGFFAPFQVRAFRFQFAGDLFTSWGTEMELIVLGWYVLVETNSVLLLTVFGALQYAGTVIAPALGVAADRHGARNVLAGMRAVYATVAATVLTLALTGLLRPAFVLVLAGVTGMIRASDTGMSSALSATTLPANRLMGGLGLGRLTYDSARIAGTLAGAAVYAAIGMAPACLVFATFHCLGCLFTWLVGAAPRAARSSARASPWGEMREGMAYVRRGPALLAAMWLAFLVNLAAFPWTLGLLPYMARNVLHVGQPGLGSLTASFAAGAMSGSLLISLFGRRVQAARVMLAGSIVWHAMLLVFVHMPSLASACAALVLAGLGQSFCMVPMMGLLLRLSGERFRGRVMGVRMLAVYGLPVGLLITGALIPRLGYRETAILYCGTGLLCVLLIAWRWRADLLPRTHPANAG